MFVERIAASSNYGKESMVGYERVLCPNLEENNFEKGVFRKLKTLKK
jgi:hypothetical protein